MQTPIIAKLFERTPSLCRPSSYGTSVTDFCRYKFGMPVQDEVGVFEIILPDSAIPDTYIGHWFELTGFTVSPQYMRTDALSVTATIEGVPIIAREEQNGLAPNGALRYRVTTSAVSATSIRWLRDGNPKIYLPQT